jgi:hypothetical protein
MRTISVTLTVLLAMAAPARADTQLGVPGRANSTPWVAAIGSFVVVTWAAAAGGKGDIYSAVSRDGGQTFDAPVRVNRAAGEARIGGEMAPRVALHLEKTGEPVITVLWNARDSSSSAVRMARSRDGGRTFDAPSTLQSKGAGGDRGWQALAVDMEGAPHAIWLDHREMAAAKHEEHKGEHDGVAMAQRSALYYKGQGPEQELFKGVCYCCKTAMAVGPKGEIVAAWRHVFAGNFRDMGFTISRDGGRSFSPLVRVSEDGWSIAGCPDDGPAIAIDASSMVHLAWPTVLNGDEGAILYSTSRDGKSFSRPVRVPTLGAPKPSHPFVMIDRRGRTIVAWDELRNGVRTAALRRSIAPQTASFGEADILDDKEPAMYPVTAVVSNGIVAAWTSGPPQSSRIKVRVIE